MPWRKKKQEPQNTPPTEVVVEIAPQEAQQTTPQASPQGVSTTPPPPYPASCDHLRYVLMLLLSELERDESKRPLVQALKYLVGIT